MSEDKPAFHLIYSKVEVTDHHPGFERGIDTEMNVSTCGDDTSSDLIMIEQNFPMLGESTRVFVTIGEMEEIIRRWRECQG